MTAAAETAKSQKVIPLKIEQTKLWILILIRLETQVAGPVDYLMQQFAHLQLIDCYRSNALGRFSTRADAMNIAYLFFSICRTTKVNVTPQLRRRRNENVENPPIQIENPFR